MEIALKPEHERLLKEWVASGEYASLAEAVGGLVDARARDKKKLEWLRREVQKGADELDRGEYIEFQGEEDVEAFLDGIEERAKQERTRSAGDVAP